MHAIEPIEPAHGHPGRRRRLVADASDAAAGGLAVLAALLLAVLWLLARTGAGRTDPGDADAVLAAALVAAALPAWSAWLAWRTWRDGATPGQRRAGLAVLVVQSPGADRGRALLRLALHPLALPLWGWLALTAAIAGPPWLWLAPALVAAAVALGGALSLALLLARPDRPALHDRLAGTTLVPRT